jgi:hypothetical protein
MLGSKSRTMGGLRDASLRPHAPPFLNKKSAYPRTHFYPLICSYLLACRLQRSATGLARRDARPPPRRSTRTLTLPGSSVFCRAKLVLRRAQGARAPRAGVLTQAAEQVLAQRRTSELMRHGGV